MTDIRIAERTAETIYAEALEANESAQNILNADPLARHTMENYRRRILPTLLVLLEERGADQGEAESLAAELTKSVLDISTAAAKVAELQRSMALNTGITQLP